MVPQRRSNTAEYVETQYRGKVDDHLYRTMQEIAREIDARQRMLDILFDDAKTAMQEAITLPPDQYRYRTLVRTLFATIEGQLSIIKAMVYQWYRLKAVKLTKLDLRKLLDEAIVLEDAPPLLIKPLRQPLKDNLVFAFKMFGSTPGQTLINLDTNSPGWNAFCNSINIRDNLVHPKTERNLLLTPDDLVQVIRAWDWFADTSSRVIGQRLDDDDLPPP